MIAATISAFIGTIRAITKMVIRYRTLCCLDRSLGETAARITRSRLLTTARLLKVNALLKPKREASKLFPERNGILGELRCVTPAIGEPKTGKAIV